MAHKILISAPYMAREKKKIEEMLKEYPFDADWIPVEERLEESDLLPIISKYHGILCGDDRITKKVLDAATHLRVIVKWGTGIDSIDKAYAESKGIAVLRTPGAFTDPVSETTIGMMLNHTRKLVENDRIVKDGGWDKPQGYLLREKVVGIIGFGNIGQEVARKLMSFRPKVLVNDIKPIDKEALASLNVEHASKDDIYERADIITLHCDLNPESKHLLNKETFSKMKKKPYIINNARGPIIKEDDLIDALTTGAVSGVGLDVFEHEPLSKESPLRSMDAVIASCHNTNSSPLCWDAVHKNSLNMMAEGLQD